MKKMIALMCAIAIMSTLYMPTGMADTVYANEGDVSAVSVVQSGTCGNNARWELSDDGTLTISGTGDMKSSPWDKGSIKTVIIENGIISIGYRAFSFCSSLTSITIPEGVTSIGNAAFDGCSSLASITIPEGVTSIGDDAFEGCSSLTSITIPESVTSIGNSAFYDCSRLTDIYYNGNFTDFVKISIPFNNTNFTSAKLHCNDMSCDNWGKCGDTIGYYLDEETGTLTIGGTGDINASSSWDKGSIKTVIIENGITSIGSWVFSGCSSLTSITLPEGVTFIGYRAFSGCSNLTSITIPESVTSIGDSAFNGCSGITDIYYSGNFTDFVKISVPFNYTNCTNTKLHCSDMSYDNWGKCGDTVAYYLDEETGILTISGTGDMNSSPWDKGCIKTVIIENGVTSIDWSAFNGCSSLTSITIPESVTSIGYSAFYDCSSLASIAIPEGVTSIGYSAFNGCSSLTSITLPEGVTSIGNQTFYGCSSLTSITIPEGVTSIDNMAFEGCSSLTSITIPEGVTSIGSWAFSGCSNLTSITIPESVTSIGSSAFSNCNSLTSITIPENVISIGNWAFSYCRQLATITILAENVDFGNDVFQVSDGVSIIGMAGGSVQAYAEKNQIKFIPLKVYTITFHTNGGSEVDSISAYQGTAITEPISTKAESEFQGWYRDAALTERFIFTTMPAENITLYAKWAVKQYTITFHTNGGNTIAPLTQEYNSRLTKPTNPSKVGYTFAGWYRDEELTQEYAFPATMPAGDIDLYAKWTAKQYTITFHTNGGSHIAPLTQGYNSPLTQPDNPSKAGYTFAGWYRDEGLTQEYAFPATMPAGDVDLYAKWNVNSYTITFHTNGGNHIAPITQEYNSPLTQPTNPSKEEYTFAGWYCDEELTQEYAFPASMPAGDMDLYAKWTIMTFTITYYANGGTGAPAKTKKEYGITKKISSSIPSRQGYKFMGWAASNTSAEVVYKPGDDYTENKDINLYAVWQYGGKVSDGVEWYFDDSTRTVHIAGKGQIPNYDADSTAANPAPWSILAGQVKHIVVHSGITKIGDYLAGNGLIDNGNGLKSIKIPDSLKSLSVNWLPVDIESRKVLDILCSYGHPVGQSAEYHKKQNVIYIDDDTTYPAIPSDLPQIPAPNETLYRVFDSDGISLLKLSSYTKQATIFYSTDGTDPIQNGEQFVSGSSIQIVPGMTLKTAAVLEGYNTAYGEYTISEAKAPSKLRLQSVTGTSATLNVNMPDGVSKVIVECSCDSGETWESDHDITKGANGTIIVNGLKPLTQYIFKLTCEYNGGGKLGAGAPVVGTTSEYLLPDCLVVSVVQPFGSVIEQAKKTITAPSVENAIVSVPVEVYVSLGAEWKLYSDENCTRPIEDNILHLANEGGNNYGYIKVIAEDGLHDSIYTLSVYRQNKSSPPVFSNPGGKVRIGTRITLSAKGEIIKYTTDNSNPDENHGILYTEPITITGETVIKAAAKEADKDEYSDVVAARYTIADETKFIAAYYAKDKVTVNLTNDVGNGTIVVVLYNDNGCLSVKTEKVGVSKKMEFDFEERGSYAKIFWWDSFRSMQPQMTTPIYVEYAQ